MMISKWDYWPLIRFWSLIRRVNWSWSKGSRPIAEAAVMWKAFSCQFPWRNFKKGFMKKNISQMTSWCVQGSGSGHSGHMTNNQPGWTFYFGRQLVKMCTLMAITTKKNKKYFLPPSRNRASPLDATAKLQVNYGAPALWKFPDSTLV